MKYVFIILADFLILVDSGKNDFNFRPNLPLGNYRVNVLAFVPCNSNSTIQFNFFLFKTSTNTTDIRGNITSLKKTIDDSLAIRISMDIKDKIGSWQSNAYVYKTPKAYTSLKNLLGAEYEKFLYSFGINETTHKRIPTGIYTTKGYDISNYPANTNLPRQIFYGTYRFKGVYMEKNGDQCGCVMFIVEVKRPWE
ncbi:uncharacterized protein LOC126549093 [Aphis gossypii]|uniref:uncharacterized protein LOC126549093 n=1 Tax=Aphis gossypii TaxID=80765 RepID=UPI0021593748|nr:uncharacterized protein LOC126549093 [Aphis gossypii]